MEHVQFMFTKYFSWTETHEHPHIYVYYDPIQYMNNFMMLSCERSVTIYTKIIAFAAYKLFCF